MRKTLLALCTAMIVISGCGSDTREAENQGESPLQLTAAPNSVPNQPRDEPNTTVVTVQNDQLSPDQVRVTAAVPLRMEVANRSDRVCTFYVEGFVTPQAVAA